MENNKEIITKEEVQIVKEFQIVLDKLQNEVSRAYALSDCFDESAKALCDFQIQCDMEKSETGEVEPSILRILQKLSNDLNFINRRNSEIAEHLHQLV